MLLGAPRLRQVQEAHGETLSHTQPLCIFLLHVGVELPAVGRSCVAGNSSLLSAAGGFRSEGRIGGKAWIASWSRAVGNLSAPPGAPDLNRSVGTTTQIRLLMSALRSLAASLTAITCGPQAVGDSPPAEQEPGGGLVLPAAAGDAALARLQVANENEYDNNDSNNNYYYYYYYFNYLIIK